MAFTNASAKNQLLSKAQDRDVVALDTAVFDRVHRDCLWLLAYEVDPQLAEAVERVARQLGYTEAELALARDPEHLHSIYMQKRFDLPFDPSIPVIERTQSAAHVCRSDQPSNKANAWGSKHLWSRQLTRRSLLWSA